MSCLPSSGRKISRVFISTSKCIYSNLAFEEHLFRTGKHQHALLLWSNDPCVVIGRHQNPWLESNVEEIQRRNVSLVRRHSGGGTVYHDLNNLNISFLTPQDEHCRPKNLEFIVKAVANRLKIQLVNTSRDDLLLNGRKVSGTAARISRGRAYHHLTLLVDTNREAMHTLLRSPYEHLINTSATRSTRAAAVGCLKEESRLVTVDELQSTLVEEYCGNFEECPIGVIDVDEVNKTNDEVSSIQKELRSWDWKFGKTPKFQIGNLLVERGVITASSDSSQVGLQFHPDHLRNQKEKLVDRA